jgi:biotin carboxyl carrier protein
MKLKAHGAGASGTRDAVPGTSLPPGLVVARDSRHAWVHYKGETWRVERVTERPAGAPDEDHDLTAPMPGRVVKVLVAEGEKVAKGAPLLLLEAMKMEHEIRSPKDGEVARVFRKAGEMVAMGDPLVEIG